MARATRSSVAQEKDKQPDSSSTASRSKTLSKKRKRSSIADNDDQPTAKQLRSGDVTIKEEATSQEPEDKLTEDALSALQITGDVPIDATDSQKILDILEMIDTQGLLDRVFPLPSNSTEASGSQPASYSFRTLLKESSQHPLCVLRAAVQHLFPISSHHRARSSTPAAQQLKFCTLALSLLDQASFHSVQIPLDLESILPFTPQTQDATDDTTEAKSASKSKSPSHPNSYEAPQPPTLKRKYALMQKLSGGEWWTSLNSEFGPPLLDGKALKDLPTAHAELVAILPSPSTVASKPDSSVSIPSLGLYATSKNPWPKTKPIGPRFSSCGKFLDYGPYASFAPTFEGEGVEVGRRGLGETIWRWEAQRRTREIELKQGPMAAVEKEAGDAEMDGVQEISPVGGCQTDSNENLAKEAVNGLEELLPPAEMATIKAALDNLELEEAVDELLERNKIALVQLDELQRERLGGEGGGASEVEEGSEEWDTAQGILKSLTLLTSLRPRSSKDTAETPPLIPPASVLRKLHRTIPVAPTQGWYGSLPLARPTALRDDSTIRIKSGAMVQPAESAPTAPGPSNVAAGASPYVYPGYSTTPYRGVYPQQQYKPGQPYYPSQYTVQPQAQGQPQAGMTQYYTNQQYSQNQYQYPSLYYQSAQGQAAGLVAASNAPQSAGAATSGYGGFFTYTAPQQQQQQGQRAVANTVIAAATAKQGVNGTVPTALPLHLRAATWGAGSASQPSTPGGAGSNAQQNFYGTYQPTAAR